MATVTADNVTIVGLVISNLSAQIEISMTAQVSLSIQRPQGMGLSVQS